MNSPIFPQIAIAIGVLTSNRGGGRRTTLADWTWHQGAIAGCRGRGAIAWCHCSVVWLGGRVTTNFGGVDVVPLLGAIVGCHCSVLWLGASVTTNFGGVDVVPLQGAHGTADYTVLYIDNAKIIFCYRGLCWYNFSELLLPKGRLTISAFMCLALPQNRHQQSLGSMMSRLE